MEYNEKLFNEVTRIFGCLGIDVKTVCKEIERAEDMVSCTTINLDRAELHAMAKNNFKSYIKTGDMGRSDFLTEWIVYSYHGAVVDILSDYALAHGLDKKIRFEYSVQPNEIGEEYYCIYVVNKCTSSVLRNGKDVDSAFNDVITRAYQDYRQRISK